jgi:hypothetical protein
VVDCMKGHLLTQLIAYIASPAGGNSINQHMTPLQMFRLTMESLGNGNMLSKGIFMQTVGAKSVGAEVCYSEFVPCLLILSHPCPSCSLCEVNLCSSAISKDSHHCIFPKEA